MKFILSRTADVRIHSKKWVVGYGLLFWLISRIAAMFLIIPLSHICYALSASRFSPDVQ